jgi:hypothetical protein
MRTGRCLIEFPHRHRGLGLSGHGQARLTLRFTGDTRIRIDNVNRSGRVHIYNETKMNTTDKLKELISRCKASVHVTVNDHRDYCMTAEAHLKELDERGDHPLEIAPEVRARMILTDTIVNLHFYPHTPIGFYEIYHYDLDKALDKALACFNNSNEVIV